MQKTTKKTVGKPDFPIFICSGGEQGKKNVVFWYFGGIKIHKNERKSGVVNTIKRWDARLCIGIIFDKKTFLLKN